MSTVVELQIYSPRWGHEDTYKVTLDNDFMEIEMQMRKARADYDYETDPVWSGEPLERIFRNDMIYPPGITQSLFEYAWKAWRNNEIDDQEVATELELVADWINATTRAKPQSEFWKVYF